MNTEREPLRLVTKPDAAHQEAVDSVVKQLEAWLVKARDGQLDGIAVAALYTDGSSGIGYSQSTSYYRLLGVIIDLQHNYADAHKVV